MNAQAIRLLLAGGALSLAFIGGVALAPGLVATAAAQGEQAHPGAPGIELFKVAADYIGITPEQLRDEMGSDQSLADVAVAHGKTRDGLVQALETATSDRIEQLVDQKGFPTPDRPGIALMKLDGLRAAVDYLGITREDLMTQLRDGKSLAEIADATAGKSRQGLIDAIVAAETTLIDQALANGRITQAQADQMKANLTGHVTRFVDATHPALGGPPFGFGPGGRFGDGGWKHR